MSTLNIYSLSSFQILYWWPYYYHWSPNCILYPHDLFSDWKLVPLTPFTHFVHPPAMASSRHQSVFCILTPGKKLLPWFQIFNFLCVFMILPYFCIFLSGICIYLHILKLIINDITAYSCASSLLDAWYVIKICLWDMGALDYSF